MSKNNNTVDMNDYRKKREKKKAPPQDIISYFIISVVFVVIIIYVGNAVVNYADSPDISVGSVSMGSIEIPKVTDGIIIRDERVYTSSSSGVVTFNSADNERVRKDSIICAVVDAGTEAILSQSIAEVESQIFNVQNLRADLILSSPEVDQRNSQIKKMVDISIPRLMTAGIASVYELKDNVSETIDLRNQIILTEGYGSARGLVETRSVFEERLRNAKDVIRTTRSGIVSYWVDGLEEVFTFDAMDSLTPEQIRFTGDYSRLSATRSVEPGDKLFKVVESNEWYIAAYISNDQIFGWLPGSDRIIYIESADNPDVFIPIEMRVTRLVSGENTSYIILKSNSFMIDYLNTRNIRFKTSKDEYDGYQIPKLAIIDRTVLSIPTEYIFDNESGYFVMKRANGADSLVSVSLASEYNIEEATVYVHQDFDGLKLGDIITKAGEASETFSVTEVENIKGIYKVNRGYTEFFRVHIDENTYESGGYFILDPSLNAGVRISDRIILDARNVREKQIIN